MLTKEKIESYRQSIIRGLRKPLFKELNQMVTAPENNLDPSYKEGLDALNSQWRKFVSKRTMGVLNYSEERQTENIISSGLLALLQEIEDDIIPNPTPNPTPELDYSLKKIALVIGCNDYPKAPLRNAVNDANGMSKALKEANFHTSIYTNLTSKEMEQAINQFAREANQYDLALVYFAGHGIEIDGANYLIPVDADISKGEPVKEDCIELSILLGYMELDRAAANVIILDACRDNPFRSFAEVNFKRGLAPVKAPSGSLIAYATAVGKRASDGGKTGHGLFTEHLLNYINKKDKNLKITDLLMKVRAIVEEESDKRQVPWDASSLKKSFSLHD